MIPLTSVAFMEGILKQTHGITLLLGDGWFADMTIYEALDVIERRCHYLKEHLNNWELIRKDTLERNKLFHDTFNQFSLESSPSSSTPPFIDIRESLDHDQEISFSHGGGGDGSVHDDSFEKLYSKKESKSKNDDYESKDSFKSEMEHFFSRLTEFEELEKQPLVVGGGGLPPPPHEHMISSTSYERQSKSHTKPDRIQSPMDIGTLRDIPESNSSSPSLTKFHISKFKASRLASSSSQGEDK